MSTSGFPQISPGMIQFPPICVCRQRARQPSERSLRPGAAFPPTRACGGAFPPPAASWSRACSPQPLHPRSSTAAMSHPAAHSCHLAPGLNLSPIMSRTKHLPAQITAGYAQQVQYPYKRQIIPSKTLLACFALVLESGPCRKKDQKQGSSLFLNCKMSKVHFADID